MASFTVADGEQGAYEKTLTASTVDTVSFTRDLRGVQVLNEGVVGIYFRVDGTAPTVGPAAAYYVPPSAVLTVPSTEGGVTVVKLISSGTPKYSVSEAV